MQTTVFLILPSFLRRMYPPGSFRNFSAFGTRPTASAKRMIPTSPPPYPELHRTPTRQRSNRFRHVPVGHLLPIANHPGTEPASDAPSAPAGIAQGTDRPGSPQHSQRGYAPSTTVPPASRSDSAPFSERPVLHPRRQRSRAHRLRKDTGQQTGKRDTGRTMLPPTGKGVSVSAGAPPRTAGRLRQPTRSAIRWNR